MTDGAVVTLRTFFTKFVRRNNEIRSGRGFGSGNFQGIAANRNRFRVHYQNTGSKSLVESIPRSDAFQLLETRASFTFKHFYP